MRLQAPQLPSLLPFVPPTTNNTFWSFNVCFSPAAIDEVRTRGESCGGEVTCVVRGCPKGLGAPVFDKLEAELAKAVMSLPASKVGTPGCVCGGGGGGVQGAHSASRNKHQRQL